MSTMPREYIQEYLNAIIQAGAEDNVYTIPKEYPSIIQAGAEYHDLIARPGWRRLLDDLEIRANLALAEVRKCKSSDPADTKALVDRWREAEDSLQFVQVRSQEAIAARSAAISDIRVQVGEDVAESEISTAMDVGDSGDAFIGTHLDTEEDMNINDFMNRIGQRGPLLDPTD